MNILNEVSRKLHDNQRKFRLIVSNQISESLNLVLIPTLLNIIGNNEASTLDYLETPPNAS